jgi:hypothetical protein
MIVNQMVAALGGVLVPLTLERWALTRRWPRAPS